MVVRVILDTCAVRHIAHQDDLQLDLDAIRGSSEDLRFSIADAAHLELVSQLTKGELDFAAWRHAVSELRDVLDEEWPVFPGGSLLHRLTGLNDDGEVDWELMRQHFQAGWDVASKAREAAELGDVRYATSSNGEVYRVGTGELLAPGEQKNEWKRWKEAMEETRGAVAAKDTSPLDCARAVLAGAARREGFEPDQLEKMIPVARLHGYYIYLIQTGYKPGTKRNRGDAFDQRLLWYLPLPAVVCTADGKFIDNRLTPAGITSGVVRCSTLNEHVREGNVHELLPEPESLQHFFGEWLAKE